MEILFEIIVELIVDGCIEVGKSRKVPPIIRYPLIALIAIFFLAVTGGLIVLGINVAKNNLIAGILLSIVGAGLLIGSVIMFRKSFFEKKRADNSKN